MSSSHHDVPDQLCHHRDVSNFADFSILGTHHEVFGPSAAPRAPNQSPIPTRLSFDCLGLSVAFGGICWSFLNHIPHRQSVCSGALAVPFARVDPLLHVAARILRGGLHFRSSLGIPDCVVLPLVPHGLHCTRYVHLCFRPCVFLRLVGCRISLEWLLLLSVWAFVEATLPSVRLQC